SAGALPEVVAALGGVLRGRQRGPEAAHARDALLQVAEASAPPLSVRAALSRLRPGARGRDKVVAGLRQSLRRSREPGGDAGERTNAAAALVILGDWV